MPDIQPNFVAVAIAVVLNFFLGYAWYTPLFGKTWLRELGLPADHAEQGAGLAKGLLANITGCFLIALVLGNNIAAWTPSTWGIEGQAISPISQALQAAFASSRVLHLAWVLPSTAPQRIRLGEAQLEAHGDQRRLSLPEPRRRRACHHPHELNSLAEMCRQNRESSANARLHLR
jgi:hypothetical protein